MQRTIFRGPLVLRIATPALFGLFALFGIPSILGPGKGGVGSQIFGGAIVAACAVLMVRGARSATLVADARGLRYRSLLRTRFWPWSRLDQLDVVERVVGMSGARSKQLVLVDVDGNRVNIVELNSSPRAEIAPIDSIADEVNRMIAAASPSQE